jgi:uncharacterized membrane protein YfbV (UPF0208 family)
MTTVPHPRLQAARTLTWQKQPERLDITVDIGKATRRLFEYCEAIGEESIVQKAALLAFRIHELDRFRRIKNRIEAYQQDLEPVFANAPTASALAQVGLLQALGDIHADIDISPGNAQWVVNIERAYQQLENHLDQIDELIDTCTLANLDETAQATTAY